MPAWLRLVGNYLKTFWWVIVLVLAALLFIFGGFVVVNNKKKKATAQGEVTDSFVKSAASKVSDAVTDIKVERAVISTRSEILRTELEKVREEPDGKERREKLADILAQRL